MTLQALTPLRTLNISKFLKKEPSHIMVYNSKYGRYALVDFTKTYTFYNNEVFYGIDEHHHKIQISTNNYYRGSSTIDPQSIYNIFKKEFLTDLDKEFLKNKKNLIKSKLDIHIQKYYKAVIFKMLDNDINNSIYY